MLAAPGAEKLSDSGDMLMLSPGNKSPEKINASLTANCDMRKVVEFISESISAHDTNIFNGGCKSEWTLMPNGRAALASLLKECSHDDTSLEVVIY